MDLETFNLVPALKQAEVLSGPANIFDRVF